MTKNLIYTLRTEKKLTLNQLAQKIGVQAPTLSKWESGAIVPARGKLERLAKIFEVDFEVLEDIAPQCLSLGCDMRATNEGYCKKHFNRIRAQHVKPTYSKALNDASTMGERLRILRESKQLSFEQLAQNFGVTCSTIEAWECNWIKPSLHMLLDISAYFFVTTRFLERGVVEGE